MPSAEQHLKQAQHNASLAVKLLGSRKPQYPDWALTATFYAAVHYINHYFMRTVGMAPRSHKVRSSYIHKYSQTKGIAFEFENLRNLSEQARYYCVRPAAERSRELLHNDLQRIMRAAV